MIGTLETTGKPHQLLSAALAARDSMRSIGWRGRAEFLRFYDKKIYKHDTRHMAKTIRALERCVMLAGIFKTVELDKSVVRTMRVNGDSYGSERQIEVPLIFYTKLPAKIKTAIVITVERQSYKAIATTPMPTPEALVQIREHGKKFDELELWWVPNEIMVQSIPNPDPIVVGVVNVPNNRRFCFELHRWIDESVEAGWWTREGY